MNISNSTFTQNISGGSGGAVNLGGAAKISNSTFGDNSSSRYGGAINMSSVSLSISNSQFESNSALINGGALHNFRSTLVLTNCSIHANISDGAGGAIYSDYDATTNLNNSIVWGNQDSTGVGTSSSSLNNGDGSYANIETYSHSLIQGINPAGVNNLDGTDSGNDPLFMAGSGDLRLQAGSPAIDAGDNTADPDGDDGAMLSIADLSVDLSGRVRVYNDTVDLGAHEGGYSSFATDFPSVSDDPNGDANGNGVSNFEDYAVGGDPTDPTVGANPTQLRGRELSYSYRSSDYQLGLLQNLQKSKSLDADSWVSMIEGVDYVLRQSNEADGKTSVTVDLIDRGDDKQFYRQLFYSN